MHKRNLGLLSAAAFIGVAAGAQAAGGWYVSGGVGPAFLQDSSSTATDPSLGTADFDTEFDPGFGVHGAVGHSWDGFRLEGEVSYRKNDVDTLTVTSTTGAISSLNLDTLGSLDADGDVSALGFMANAWYDFDTGSPWKPFIGGGVGTARISLNDISSSTISLADDEDQVFAYQAGVGIGYELTPTIIVSLGYRFFGTLDPEFTDVDGIPFDAEYRSHNVEVGVRLHF